MPGCLTEQRGNLTRQHRSVFPCLPLAVSTSTLTLCLIKIAIPQRERKKNPALDINSGKVRGHAKSRSYSGNYTLGHPVDMEQQTHQPLLTPHTQSFTNILHLHVHTSSGGLSFYSLFVTLLRSNAHTLRSSMVGSDTKLMPCHTGCQQISQWITPQPLDVHRAKGHKNGRESEEERTECQTGCNEAHILAEGHKKNEWWTA